MTGLFDKDPDDSEWSAPDLDTEALTLDQLKALSKVIPEPELRAVVWTKDTMVDGVAVTRPGGATAIMNLLTKHGWEQRATFARGPVMHATQLTLLGMKDNFMVKARKGSQEVVAVWLDAKFHTAYRWDIPDSSDERICPQHVNSNALKEAIRS